MDDVVGNIGEPLDFAEHCLSDEDDGLDENKHAKREDVVGVSWVTSVTNLKAESSSGRSSYSADADVLDISGGKPKVRSCHVYARQSMF